MSIKYNIFLALVNLCLCLSLATACNENYYAQGKALYNYHCANCHMEDGSGLEDVIPSIVKSSYFNIRKNEFTCLLLNGAGAERTDGLEMPSFVRLNNVELLNITNYVNAKWSTDFTEHSILKLDQERKDCNSTKVLQKM